MDPSKIDSLVHRLVKDPHDEEALAIAHQAGASDPKSYALLLERVGVETRDAAYASHWLSEAANVWSTTLGDAHRAARVLMQAIDRDPTQHVASDRLAQLYREKGDYKALVALLERRTKALGTMVPQTPEIRSELAEMHEELGHLWNDNLQQPKKGQENLRRAVELSDPARQIALLREEAAAQREGGNLAAASQSLARARELDGQDVALQQEYGALIVERIAAGEPVSTDERSLGAGLLVGLAEMYDGEHGLAYSAGALDIDPGQDRAVQLYAFYAHELAREDDVGVRYLAYIEANPEGAMAGEVRWLLAGSYEAAGQPDNAIQILEPLRALGDADASAKLRDLYAQAGRSMPSAPPPPLEASGSRRGPRDPHENGVGAGSHADPMASRTRVETALDAAQAFAKSNKRPDAYRKFREVLEIDPVHPEALSWVQDYLRTKRDFAPLRDVLLAAVRAAGESVEARRDRLREIAGLCESNLRDTEGAIGAWKQLLAIDRTDEPARVSLTRLLERTQRWDDLVNLFEQEENAEVDVEKKLALLKKLATLHEAKRKDLGAAAEVWERIANLTPDDDQAISAAVKMFHKAGLLDRAAQVIAANAPSVTDATARSGLLQRLGELYEELDDPARAGDAYADAAGDGSTGDSTGASSGASSQNKLWEAAERCFVASERWDRAGQTAVLRGDLESDVKVKSRHYARSADYLGRGGDEAGSLVNLVQAADLDPGNEDYAHQLVERYTASTRWDDLVQLLLKRGDYVTDKAKRSALRRQAADLYANQLGDKDAARETWRRILEDGDDEEVIERLIEDAIERNDPGDATSLLQRLEKAAKTAADKARIALREAELIADSIGDVETAIARYERIVAELDPTCRLALQAVADLQEARDNPEAAASALERELKLVTDPTERAPIATRLARLYDQMGDAERTIGALEAVRAADPDDFDALAQLSDLCEKTEKWGKLAELLAQRIEVEGDEAEATMLTGRLAQLLADKLNRGDEALATLAEMADQGDEGLRAAYVELGDRLGWRGIVATKLVEWWSDAKPGPDRITHLRGAFERFAEVGRDPDAVKVATELVRSKGADPALAEHLEKLSAKIKDLDALATAHDLLARDMTGMDRARELVRQAEVRARTGAPRLEAIQHGEAGLTSVPPAEAEEFLQRLAALADKPADVVDLYERQVTRCKSPGDRADALARAAQIAAARGQNDRARGFFDLALSSTPSDEVVAMLESAARSGDGVTGGDQLRRALCAALEAGGQGARDGGRTRGALLRRAALITHLELKDLDEAFVLFGVALVAHVDPLTLDALEALAQQIGEPRRAEETLSHVLEEVFDGPLVRQLLARRAKLRRQPLGDTAGAAADLKKLHDLSPNDAQVLGELTALLTELGDYRGMVRVFEDQIVRGKDMNARAELARKVARMWESELSDPREAADAWRRVLRMKQSDPEATAGLERAKANMLKSLEPGSEPRPATQPPPGGASAASPRPEAPPAAAGDVPTPAPEGDRPTPVPTADVATPLAASVDAAASAHATEGTSIESTTRLVLEAVDMGPGLPAPAVETEPPHSGDGEDERDLTNLDALGSALAAEAAVTAPPPVDASSVGIDFGDTTYPHAAAASPPTESELVIDVDASGETSAIDVDEDILVADEMAELVDDDEPEKDAKEPPLPGQAKRSVPPPLPRGS
jgi:tetratricopeptide (TPR) repeat protein